MMTDRSDRGSHKPRGAERFERDDVIRDAVRGVHQGQQPCGAARTGRTHGCTRPVLITLQIPLAPQGPSTHAPRFQAGDKLASVCLHELHPEARNSSRSRGGTPSMYSITNSVSDVQAQWMSGTTTRASCAKSARSRSAFRPSVVKSNSSDMASASCRIIAVGAKRRASALAFSTIAASCAIRRRSARVPRAQAACAAAGASRPRRGHRL